LQRSELIASRFGRVVLREMLDVVNTNLKPYSAQEIVSSAGRTLPW
jgi:hypothetical protein